MGLTLVEKILSEHAGKEVHADELIISKAFNFFIICKSPSIKSYIKWTKYQPRLLNKSKTFVIIIHAPMWII